MPPVQITPPPLSHGSLADLLCTIMVLCKGFSNDKTPCWAYMCIKPSMAKAFREARARGGVELEEYGTVIEAGEGEEVPLEVRQRMEQQYGMRHDFEDLLIRAIEAHS